MYAAPIDLGKRSVRTGTAPCYFFLVPPGSTPDRTRYEHPAIALAEGLAALGLPFVANIDHWPPAPNAAPLFRADPAVDPYTCSVAFFTSDWFEEGCSVPQRLFEGPERPVTVYFDHEDGSRIHSRESDFPPFDLVLRSHFVRNAEYPSSFRPWAFGLTNRIIEAVRPIEPHGSRTSQVLVSYRHMRYPHGVRAYMNRNFLSRLGDSLPVSQYTEDRDHAMDDSVAAHFWRLTGRRHSSRYYAALRASTVSACFGGYFIPRWPRDERQLLSRIFKRAIQRLNLRTARVTQFDSWRFWESLAAGCATIHLDLARHGAVLPVTPTNWEHYIGLSSDHLDRDMQRMFEDPSLFERIGLAGQAWSLNAYSPLAAAKRLLALMGTSASSYR